MCKYRPKTSPYISSPIFLFSFRYFIPSTPSRLTASIHRYHISQNLATVLAPFLRIPVARTCEICSAPCEAVKRLPTSSRHPTRITDRALTPIGDQQSWKQ